LSDAARWEIRCARVLSHHIVHLRGNDPEVPGHACVVELRITDHRSGVALDLRDLHLANLDLGRLEFDHQVLPAGASPMRPPKHEVDDAFPAVFTTHRIELTVLGLTAQLLSLPLQYGVQTLITDHQCLGVSEDPSLDVQK